MGISKDIYSTLVYDEPKKLKDTMKTKDGLEKKSKSERIAALKMVMYSFIFWVASEFSYGAFDVPSRRLCNISWVFYQIWILQTTFSIVYISDRFLVDQSNKNIVIQAVVFNQLILFGASSLLTGLVNITMKTLH